MFGGTGFLCSWQSVEIEVITSMGSSLCFRVLFRLVLGAMRSRTLPPKDQSYGGKPSQGHGDVGKIDILLGPAGAKMSLQMVLGRRTGSLYKLSPS